MPILAKFSENIANSLLAIFRQVVFIGHFLFLGFLVYFKVRWFIGRYDARLWSTRGFDLNFLSHLPAVGRWIGVVEI